MVLESGFTYAAFLNALLLMWAEVAAAFLAQKLIAGPLVTKLVAQWFKPGVDKPVFIPTGIITVARAGCTAALMAPLMTLFVTIFHHGFSAEIPLVWLPKLVINFPFALCLQIFYIGPLVRFLFRTIFKNQLSFNKGLPVASTTVVEL